MNCLFLTAAASSWSPLRLIYRQKLPPPPARNCFMILPLETPPKTFPPRIKKAQFSSSPRWEKLHHERREQWRTQQSGSRNSDKVSTKANPPSHRWPPPSSSLHEGTFDLSELRAVSAELSSRAQCDLRLWHRWSETEEPNPAAKFRKLKSNDSTLRQTQPE